MDRLFTDVQNQLLACLSGVLADGGVAPLRNGIDWEQFVALARREGVLHLFSQPVVPALPPEVVSYAFRERTLVAQRNLFLGTELVRVIERFDAARLETLAFKGVVAALQFHGDLAGRPSGDLDLLVRVGDHNRAADVLRSAGYQLSIDYPDSLQSVFSNPLKQTTIDLHWGVPPKRARFNHRILWRHQSHIELMGARIPTFDVATAIALTGVNTVKAYWDVSLRHLVDVFRSVKGLSEADADRVLARCRGIGCTKFLLAAIYVCDRLFGSLPATFVRSIDRNPVAAAVGEEVIQHLFEHSRGAPATRVFASRQTYEEALDARAFGALRDRVRLAVTPNEVDKAWVVLPDHLRFLYFIVRPIRLLRYGRRRVQLAENKVEP